MTFKLSDCIIKSLWCHTTIFTAFSRSKLCEMHVFIFVVSRKFFQLECLEGGQWEENGCEPISCPALPDVFQGMYSCTNELYYDTLCTLQCPDVTENVRFPHT